MLNVGTSKTIGKGIAWAKEQLKWLCPLPLPSLVFKGLSAQKRSVKKLGVSRLVWLVLIGSALMIVATGLVLVRLADIIADETQIGRVWIGSTLLAWDIVYWRGSGHLLWRCEIMTEGA